LVLVFVFAVGATVLFFLQLKLRKVNKELKENTIVVNELNSKLSASDNTKNKLFRIISHDLKGPLSANLLAIRLISDTIESGDTAMVKKLTLMLTKSNTAVLEMLDTLLNWSAMQIDESKTYFDNINLKGLVEMIKRQFADQLVVKEIKIKFEIDSTITFISDSNLLLIVLRNLVSNAIKFSPRGSTIVVSSGIIDGKPSIAIVDQGIGMPQELIDKIFTMDASKNRQGTDGEITNGYGMMMIKDMTDKLGIHIEIQSEVNKGSTFKLVFPLEATADNLETVKASPLDGMLK
jgi:signal transduction histidine kinase